MKVVQFFLLVCVSTVIPRFSHGQPVSIVSVVFMDGKQYYATESGKTATTLTAKFVHSGAVYEFDNTGTILKSTGAYKVGDKVRCIITAQSSESVYSQATMAYNPEGEGNVRGVVFGDGKTYYCRITASVIGEFSVYFLHSNSNYTFQRAGSVWKVKSTDKGAYPPGHLIQDIFKLEKGTKYYCL